MTRYGAEARARIIAHPGSDPETAVALEIPRRTVSAIRKAFREDPDAYGPTVRRLVEAAEGDTLELVREVRATTLREMLRRAKDPKTRAGELASIFREVRDEASLLEGRATSRTEASVTYDDTPELYQARQALDNLIRELRAATPEEIAEWLATEAGGTSAVTLVEALRLEPGEVSDGLG